MIYVNRWQQCTFSGRRSTFSCILGSLSAGRHIPGRHSLSLCRLTLSLDLGRRPVADHCRAVELLGQVRGGHVFERQRRLEAEVTATRHDTAAAELVVEVAVAAAWTVGSARRPTAARRRLQLHRR